MTASHCKRDLLLLFGAECKREFEKEPEKYVRKEQTERNKGDRAAPPEKTAAGRTCLSLVKGNQGIVDGRAGSRKGTKDSLCKLRSEPGIVDWDGPDKEGAPPTRMEQGMGGISRRQISRNQTSAWG